MGGRERKLICVSHAPAGQPPDELAAEEEGIRDRSSRWRMRMCLFSEMLDLSVLEMCWTIIVSNDMRCRQPGVFSEALQKVEREGGKKRR
eukprot:757128-Hanusia_phi.AAC.2